MPKLPHVAWSRRVLLFAALLSALVLNGCGEDDEDRIDTFIEAVTGEVTTARIDHVLTTYLSLEQRPLSATVLGDMRLYRAEDEQRLKDAVHQRLQRFLGSRIKVLRRRVDIKGDSARVELQLLGDNAMGNVIYELHKSENRWFMNLVRVGN